MIFNKANSYKTFIFELLAVFIGITASFWVADYTKLLEERNLVDKYLEGFIKDLERDKKRLIDLIEIREKQSFSTIALLDSIDEKILDVDSFYNHYFFLFPFHKFIPNTNTLEEVMNSSHLRLISDEDLKSKILELNNMYKAIIVSEDHVYQDRSEYFYNKITMNNVELDGLFVAKENGSFSLRKDVNVYRRDAENFKKNRFFKSFLNLLEYNLQVQIPDLEKARDECDLILSMINKRLSE